MAYIDEIKNRLKSYDADKKNLEQYKTLYDLLQKGKWNQDIPEWILNNLDFIKSKSDEYNNILKNEELDKSLLSKYDSLKGKWWTLDLKPTWEASPDSNDMTLWSALNQQSNEYIQTQKDILSKIEWLWNIYGNEKNELLDKINTNNEALKSSIIGKNQEDVALAEWLSTRRWIWTKAMENITKASLANKKNAEIAQADSDSIDKIKEVTNLYNQLLTNLIQQYKATKDTYTLWKIQNAVNILNSIETFKQNSTS